MLEGYLLMVWMETTSVPVRGGEGNRYTHERVGGEGREADIYT